MLIEKPFISWNKYFSIYATYLGSTHYTYKYAFFCRPHSYIGKDIFIYIFHYFLIIGTLTNKRRMDSGLREKTVMREGKGMKR